VSDKNTAKDILKLKVPTQAPSNFRNLFENQAVPLNLVIMADQERDFEAGRVSISFVSPW